MRGPPLSTRGMSGTVSVPDTTRLYPAASHADMSGRYREFCRDTPWQGPCDLCRTRSPRDLALGLPVVYEHCTYISRLARCALSKIGLAGDVEGSYGLLLPLLICLYVLTYFRPMPRLFCILHRCAAGDGSVSCIPMEMETPPSCIRTDLVATLL